MATIESFTKLSIQERIHRYFSVEFKMKKVNELDRNVTTVSQNNQKTRYQEQHM